jgi:hypothetical protein
MKTKGQMKAENRRIIRHREKNNKQEFAHQSMMGKVYKRGYGKGIVD